MRGRAWCPLLVFRLWKGKIACSKETLGAWKGSEAKENTTMVRPILYTIVLWEASLGMLQESCEREACGSRLGLLALNWSRGSPTDSGEYLEQDCNRMHLCLQEM